MCRFCLPSDFRPAVSKNESRPATSGSCPTSPCTPYKAKPVKNGGPKRSRRNSETHNVCGLAVQDVLGRLLEENCLGPQTMLMRSRLPSSWRGAGLATLGCCPDAGTKRTSKEQPQERLWKEIGCSRPWGLQKQAQPLPNCVFFCFHDAWAHAWLQACFGGPIFT